MLLGGEDTIDRASLGSCVRSSRVVASRLNFTRNGMLTGSYDCVGCDLKKDADDFKKEGDDRQRRRHDVKAEDDKEPGVEPVREHINLARRVPSALKRRASISASCSSMSS